MRAGLVALVALAGACKAPDPGPRAATPTPPLAEMARGARIAEIVGNWQWVHVSEADGVTRVERERWRFEAPVRDRATGAVTVTGRYRRDLIAVAGDGKPFLCNQYPSYGQRAVFDVLATVGDGAVITVAETAYRTAPSPCEPGFRRLGSYQADVDRKGVLHLTWDGGEQTLTRLPDDSVDLAGLDLPSPPLEQAARFAGAWVWSLRSRDRTLMVRDEEEAWDLAIAGDGTAGGTYLRTVTVSSADGSDLDCAGAASYRYVDRYTLRGKLDGELLMLEEIAVAPGEHPCLATTPERHLDRVSAVASGEHLVLTWPGDRRQVLRRR